MSLARLWRGQGKVRPARELLAPVYGWFTEGFETRDLKEAKVLLEELACTNTCTHCALPSHVRMSKLNPPRNRDGSTCHVKITNRRPTISRRQRASGRDSGDRLG